MQSRSMRTALVRWPARRRWKIWESSPSTKATQAEP